MRADLIQLIVRAVVLTCVFAAPATVAADDGPARTAIVSAFEPEWRALTAAVESPARDMVNGVEFVTGTLEGEPVVLFLSGIGMVNAAMTTQLALERYKVSRIVVSGVAGGVDPARNIGDVVIAERWGSYLYMVLARQTADGYAVPPFFGRPFANFDMMFPQEA
ncbi:MAG: 5'-methylthioadenosine/S-adenosylhomocysteine nucleosidase, partial [Pseudomonadota bacterium]